jgi:hypothetical protein
MSNPRPPEREFAAFRDALREAYSPTQADQDRMRESMLRTLSDPRARPSIDELARAAEPAAFTRILERAYPFVKQAAALLAAAGVGAAVAITQAPQFNRAKPEAGASSQARTDTAVSPAVAREVVPAAPTPPPDQPTPPTAAPLAAARTPHPRRLAPATRRPMAADKAERGYDAQTDLADDETSLTSALDPAPQKVAPSPEPSGIAEELRLVRAASAALDQSAPERALERLAEHARRFPSGELAIERRGLELIARCTINPHAVLRAERDQFLARFPSAPIAARMSRACEHVR